MKMHKPILAVVLGYFAIGAAILGVQIIAPKIFQPECVGIVKHRLTDRYFPPRSALDELEKTRTGKKDITDVSWLLRVAMNSAQWLPDFGREVIAGEMRLGSYLLGGYECTPVGAVRAR